MQEEIKTVEPITIHVKPSPAHKKSESNNETIIKVEGEDGESATLVAGKKSSVASSKSMENQEPITHIKNKSIIKNCFEEKKTRLTVLELRAFYSLKADCNIPFDNENEHHNKMVIKLWNTLFTEPLGDKIPNELWKEFGFQNSDPRTDFRGGGITGLRMLISYAENYPEMVKRMSGQTEDFLAAVSSINVTYFLIKYLHLADFLIYEKDKSEICSRKALKNFCVFLSKDPDVFYKLHDLLFTDLYELWVDLKKRKKGVTIMDFGICFDALKSKVTRALNRSFYTSFDQFKIYYSGLVAWSGKALGN
mgnify:FL=1